MLRVVSLSLVRVQATARKMVLSLDRERECRASADDGSRPTGILSGLATAEPGVEDGERDEERSEKLLLARPLLSDRMGVATVTIGGLGRAGDCNGSMVTVAGALADRSAERM